MSKWTFEDIVKNFEKHGWTVLTPTPQGESKFFKVKTKLRVVCPNKHEMERSFFVFKRGDKCRKCHFDDMKLTFEHVKKRIEDRLYQLKSTAYTNSKEKLELVCPNGHELMMDFHVFELGNDCICMRDKKTKQTMKKRYDVEHSSQVHIEFDYVKGVIEERGYYLKTEEFVSKDEKLELICPNQHLISMTFKSFQAGSDCKCMFNEKLKRTCLKRYGFDNPSKKAVKERKLNNSGV